jgi:hypothetical protein
MRRASFCTARARWCCCRCQALPCAASHAWPAARTQLRIAIATMPPMRFATSLVPMLASTLHCSSSRSAPPGGAPAAGRRRSNPRSAPPRPARGRGNTPAAAGRGQQSPQNAHLLAGIMSHAFRGAVQADGSLAARAAGSAAPRAVPCGGIGCRGARRPAARCVPGVVCAAGAPGGAAPRPRRPPPAPAAAAAAAGSGAPGEDVPWSAGMLSAALSPSPLAPASSAPPPPAPVTPGRPRAGLPQVRHQPLPRHARAPRRRGGAGRPNCGFAASQALHTHAAGVSRGARTRVLCCSSRTVARRR